MNWKSLLLLIALLLLEVAWSQAPALRGWWPHLGLVFVLFAARWMRWGPLMGLALAVGLCEDVLFGLPLGMYALTLLLGAAAAHRLRDHIYPEARPNIFVIAFVFAAAESAFLGLLAGGIGGLWFGLSLRGALAAALLAALIPRRLDACFTRPIGGPGAASLGIRLG